MLHIGDLLVSEEVEEFVDACFDFDSKIQPEEPDTGSSIESLDSNKTRLLPQTGAEKEVIQMWIVLVDDSVASVYSSPVSADLYAKELRDQGKDATVEYDEWGR